MLWPAEIQQCDADRSVFVQTDWLHLRPSGRGRRTELTRLAVSRRLMFLKFFCTQTLKLQSNSLISADIFAMTYSGVQKSETALQFKWILN